MLAPYQDFPLGRRGIAKGEVILHLFQLFQPLQMVLNIDAKTFGSFIAQIDYFKFRMVL
ncbi:hypothetical protein DESC_80010 [Desulfosarcina cetonica]|nr:hypothetical protein DESC_80010 [Desulfosarcina cetonica]